MERFLPLIKHIKYITYVIFFFGLSTTGLASDKESGFVPTYRFSGDAQLLTHFIDRGLSITDGNPALTASFLFNFGKQFRVGFWGSNLSNVTSSDDNLWLKIIGDVQIEFNKNSIAKIYIHFDKFYKSDLRNGDAFGLTYDFKSYMTQMEWLSNYQGTSTGAVHMRVGKIFPLYKKILPGISVGITLQNAEGYLNYIDLKGTGNYTVNPTFELEAGITAVSNSSQFSGRGGPYYYAGIKLNY